MGFVGSVVYCGYHLSACLNDMFPTVFSPNYIATVILHINICISCTLQIIDSSSDISAFQFSLPCMRALGQTGIADPNSFALSVCTAYKIAVPIGHGQIVGFERFGLDADALHRLYRPAFGQQPVARFQAVYLYPFSFRVKGMDAVGFDSMAAAQGIRNGQINSKRRLGYKPNKP